MKKRLIVFMMVAVLFFLNRGQAEIKQQRINFVLDQTRTILWEANTGWIEIPLTGVKIRSCAFATSSLLKYQFRVIFIVEYDPNQVFQGSSFYVNIKLRATTPVLNSGLYLTNVCMPNSPCSVDLRLGAEEKV